MHKPKDLYVVKVLLTTNWKSYDNNQTLKYVLKKKVFKERRNGLLDPPNDVKMIYFMQINLMSSC